MIQYLRFRLEVESQSKLQYASYLLTRQIAQHAKVWTIDVRVRESEIRMIEHVERVHTELKLTSLAEQREVLCQSYVHVREVRPAEDVAVTYFCPGHRSECS